MNSITENKKLLMEYDSFFELPCYEIPQKIKEKKILSMLKILISHHEKHSYLYKNLMRAYNKNMNDILFETHTENFFPVSVRLFKYFDLMSIPRSAVFKTLHSSGTTGENVSKIYLDQETSQLQTRALTKILQEFIGLKRLPMLIVDSQSIIADRNLFSARAAAIKGLIPFGRDHTYLLDNNMAINIARLDTFFKKYQGVPILIFGFTFMIWEYLFEELKRKNIKIDLQNAILVHSGGWKKLIDRAVNNHTFQLELNKFTGIKRIHNFYGIVEQVGSIFIECEKKHLHAPIFTDIFIRNLLTNQLQPVGVEGVVELVSILPKSYPGHILLTEDLGTILGIDDCTCGRKGKYFAISGRIPKAENRGCSDV